MAQTRQYLCLLRNKVKCMRSNYGTMQGMSKLEQGLLVPGENT